MRASSSIRRYATVLGLALAALAPVGPAGATGWQADPADSRIGFIYERAGNPASGFFASFQGDGRFDPAQPEATELMLTIDTGSIELGNALESAFATSIEWFDSENHPDAVYQLLTLQPTGPGTYEALGTLTIKGREKTIITEIRLAEVPGPGGRPSRVMAQGSLEIDRRGFGLGLGPMSAFVTIGDRVRVDFTLVADAGQQTVDASRP
ncbi:MAG: YceI family protein [Pseudomonadota bacterium]